MSTPRSPEFIRWLACLCAGFAAIAAGAHAGGNDVAAQRARIARERAAAEQRYTRTVRDCETRFVVTSCVEAAKAERRQTIEQLDREQAVLDDADRRRRAEEHLERIEQKQKAAADRAASAPQPRVVQREPSPAARASAPLLPRTGLPQGQAISPAQQEANRRAYEQRQQEAAAHRAEVERRNAADTQDRRPALPLPAPGAASAASAP